MPYSSGVHPVRTWLIMAACWSCFLGVVGLNCLRRDTAEVNTGVVVNAVALAGFWIEHSAWKCVEVVGMDGCLNGFLDALQGILGTPQAVIGDVRIATKGKSLLQLILA